MKKYGAYGLVEVKGESNAVIVVDRMLKTAEVEYVTQDTKCGGTCTCFCRWQCISSNSSG